ncbi:MAG: hypothetical protein JNG90_19975, partial [Planctomycetaceae bacterium]|nr:hypothetical protein [Planctomycetaceae bacterium]
SDPRLDPGMENCDICANDVFRNSWTDTGVGVRAFDEPPPMGRRKGIAASNGQASPAHGGGDQEALIQEITNRVMAALASK